MFFDEHIFKKSMAVNIATYAIERNLSSINRNNRRINIFGAGKIAGIVLNAAKRAGISIAKVVVSNGHRQSKEIINVPIYELHEVEFDPTEDVIILAINDSKSLTDITEYLISYHNLDLRNNIIPFEHLTTANDYCHGYFSNFVVLDNIGTKFGTDKAHNIHDYLKKYEIFLSAYRNCEFTLLELGIFQGASLNMWGEYFSHAQIVGVDINKECLQYADGNKSVLIADLSSEHELKKMAKMRPAIVIDDASHVYSHQIKAFLALWPALPRGGIYICEDLQTSFGEYQKDSTYADTVFTAYSFFSCLAEVATSMNLLTLHDKPAGIIYCFDIINEIGSQIEMISFIKGSCIIIKR